MLNEHSWERIQADFQNRSPFRYVVVDRFFTEESFQQLRTTTLQHWGWRHKNWFSRHLHTVLWDVPELRCVASTLKNACPQIFQGLELTSCWALLYTENSRGNLHADFATITATIWMTPEKYNRNPESGGLRLFKRRRSPKAMMHEFLSPPHVQETLREDELETLVRIPYRENRAVIFDADLFHITDELDFSAEGPESHRLNISIAYDDLVNNREGYAPYRTAGFEQSPITAETAK